MSFKIVGISNYQDEVRDLVLGDALSMLWDHNNIYDPKAIKIIFDDKMIGYVPNQNIKIKDYCFNHLEQELIVINKQSIHNKVGIRLIPKNLKKS